MISPESDSKTDERVIESEVEPRRLQQGSALENEVRTIRIKLKTRGEREGVKKGAFV